MLAFTDGTILLCRSHELRIALGTGELKAETLTKDHKPTDPEEMDRITKAGVSFVSLSLISGTRRVAQAVRSKAKVLAHTSA